MPISRADFLRALQVLGMPPDPSFGPEDVQRHYRETMKSWHPDKNPDWRDETNAYAAQINAAKETLLNWIKEGRPGWQTGRAQSESGGPSPGGAAGASKAGRAPEPQPANAAAPPQAKPSVPWKDRVFEFYWRARYLPHARILLVPLAILLIFLFGGIIAHQTLDGG